VCPDPDIQQDQGNPNQHQAQRRIRRRRADTQGFKLPIAALNSKAGAIPLADADQTVANTQTHEQTPGRPPPAAFRPAQCPHDGYLDRHVTGCSTFHGVLHPAAFLPLTVRSQPGTTLRQRDNGRNLGLLEVLEDRHGGKAAVRIHTGNRDPAGLNGCQEVRHNCIHGGARLNEHQRNGQPRIAGEDRGGGAAIVPGRTRLGFAATDPGFGGRIADLAVEGHIVGVNGDLLRVVGGQSGRAAWRAALHCCWSVDRCSGCHC